MHRDRFAPNSSAKANHHFTLALGVVPVPGWTRLSSPVLSPGTGSPPAVEPVVAQLQSPQIVALRIASSKRYLIRPEPNRRRLFLHKYCRPRAACSERATS